MQIARIDVSSHASNVAEQGFTILENVIEPDLVERLINAILANEGKVSGELIADLPADSPRRKIYGGTLRMRNLLSLDPVFRIPPVHPSVLPLIEASLDPQCLLRAMSTLVVPPGEPAQPLHADDRSMPIDRPHKPLIMNAIWALTDFTEENGATRMVPGSHLWPDLPSSSDDEELYGVQRAEQYETVPMVMPSGSVVVFNGSMVHGAGENKSQQRRFGLAIVYNDGWIRPHENLQLGTPIETLREFDPRLQELIGVRGRR